MSRWRVGDLVALVRVVTSEQACNAHGRAVVWIEQVCNVHGWMCVRWGREAGKEDECAALGKMQHDELEQAAIAHFFFTRTDINEKWIGYEMGENLMTLEHS
jgi:hypothetical protein